MSSAKCSYNGTGPKLAPLGINPPPPPDNPLIFELRQVAAFYNNPHTINFAGLIFIIANASFRNEKL